MPKRPYKSMTKQSKPKARKGMRTHKSAARPTQNPNSYQVQGGGSPRPGSHPHVPQAATNPQGPKFS